MVHMRCKARIWMRIILVGSLSVICNEFFVVFVLTFDEEFCLYFY